MSRRLTLGCFVLSAALLGAEGKKSMPEPRILSSNPFACQAGTTCLMHVRGTGFHQVRSIEFSKPGVRGRVVGSETEKTSEAPSAANASVELVQVEVTIPANAAKEELPFRLVTEEGLTNEATLQASWQPVADESQTVKAVSKFPAFFSGRIGAPGESDAFWIEIASQKTLTFEVTSGFAGFDPSVSLFEPSGSWFDAKRLNRLAFNDEPLHFPGLSSDARLTYSFAKPGRYCVKVQAFSGQGGPDFAYTLRILDGVIPPSDLHPKHKENWDERLFTRSMPGDWIASLMRRGGKNPADDDAHAPETYRAVISGVKEIPVMKVPGVLEGRLTRPAEVHTIKLLIERPQELAFEIETPEGTLPRFNPVFRLLEAGGAEIVTDVQTKLNNNGLYMMKMIQAKTTVSLRNPGEYTLEVRDITTDCAGEDFVYRLLVRPQIPHIGKMTISEDAVSLRTGATKPLNLTFEREENFTGLVAFTVDGLPAGVSVATALSPIEDKPALFNGGRMERYTPKTQKAVLLLEASPGAAPLSAPVAIKVFAHPFVNGSMGKPILVKEVPLLILPGSSS